MNQDMPSVPEPAPAPAPMPVEPRKSNTNTWLIVEMLADKVPVVNHINDLIQTFVRPAAGAIAFAASTNVIQGVDPVLAMACGLLVAGSVHLVKSAAVRPLVTATTAGAGNVPVSVAEDITSTVVSFLSVLVPVAIVVLVVGLVILLLWWWARRRQRMTA